MKRYAAMCVLGAWVISATAWAGPYAAPYGDGDNPWDPGIPGWVGPAGEGIVGDGQIVNPAFVGWASAVAAYRPASGVAELWSDSSKALGHATGDVMDVVSLGDMTAAEIAAHLADPADMTITRPGAITLAFDPPIYNGAGADLAVFENGFHRAGGPEFFAELAYVEVSSDGETFARFPSRSLTPRPTGGAGEEGWPFATIDATDVYNLAGKHFNAGGVSWGTPFDLTSLVGDPTVVAGSVNLNDIRYVRVVDIPGSGDFLDSAGEPIYDAWLTVGSAGFDLNAVGALHAGAVPGDATGDGRVDLDDFVVLKRHFGASPANHSMGDFTGDGTVDLDDFVILKRHFGRAAIPEPATSALMIAGAAAVARSRSRRRRSARRS